MWFGHCIYWWTKHPWQEVRSESLGIAVESDLLISLILGELGGLSIERMPGTIESFWCNGVDVHEGPDTFSKTEAKIINQSSVRVSNEELIEFLGFDSSHNFE